MPTPLLFTTNPIYSILEDVLDEPDMDWDRRTLVVEGRWASKEAAKNQFARAPLDGFWPESVKAKATWGGMYRVEVQAAGLSEGREKFYELTEDNGELQVYQLDGNGGGVRIFAPGWNSNTVWKMVNVEMGVPRYGLLGFSKFAPDPGKNGHPVATPFRGRFPTVPLPPWTYSGATANSTANFPGGWRQIGAPFKALGPLGAGGEPLFLPGHYKGQWFYGYVHRATI